MGKTYNNFQEVYRSNEIRPEEDLVKVLINGEDVTLRNEGNHLAPIVPLKSGTTSFADKLASAMGLQTGDLRQIWDKAVHDDAISHIPLGMSMGFPAGNNFCGARSAALLILAREEAKLMPFKSFERGDIVFPTFLREHHMLEELKVQQWGIPIGIIVDIRLGNHLLILWNCRVQAQAHSCEGQDVQHVNFNMTAKEFNELWRGWTLRDNWNADTVRPRSAGGGSKVTIEEKIPLPMPAIRKSSYNTMDKFKANSALIMTTMEDSRAKSKYPDEFSDLAERFAPPSPARGKPTKKDDMANQIAKSESKMYAGFEDDDLPFLPGKTYSHYWEVTNAPLQCGDMVKLFDTITLKVWNNRFDDVDYLDDTEEKFIEGLAMALSGGQTKDKLAIKRAFSKLAPTRDRMKPSKTPGYKYHFGSLEEAKNLVRYMLAISDAQAMSPSVDLTKLNHRCIWDHIGPRESPGILRIFPLRCMGYFPQPKTILVAPDGCNFDDRLYVNELIPVATSYEEYRLMCGLQANISKPINKQDHELQREISPGGQREQTGEANCAGIRASQTYMGSGYSGNPIRAGRSQGQTRSSSLEGTPIKPRGNSSKTRSKQLPDGPGGVTSGVSDSLRGDTAALKRVSKKRPDGTSGINFQNLFD